MEELLKLIARKLIPWIILLLVYLVIAVRKRKQQKSEPEIVLDEKGEVPLPPWSNLSPMEQNEQLSPPIESKTLPIEPKSPPTQRPSIPTEQLMTEIPLHCEVSVSESEMRLRREDGSDLFADETGAPVPETHAIAGMRFSPQTFRQGIILSEILGYPKSRRLTRR